MRETFWLLGAALALAAGCKGNESPSGGERSAEPRTASATAQTISINGAGATFPYPLYSKWTSEYQNINPNVRINYQSVGSGAGIKQITDKTVDFGATDAPMSDEQLAKAPGKLVHVPMTIGAVVLTYNLPELASSTLKLTPEVLSGVFLGRIKTWNDPTLASLNPGVKLPARPITVVHRSDGSGTTAVFTNYLVKTSPAWRDKVGVGTAVNWPAGTGAKGNEGVTGQIKTTPGTLGYTELAYAVQNKLPTAELKNAAGKFVTATLESVTAAAAGLVGKTPDDLRVSLVDAPGEAAYPIASFTYILVYEDMAEAPKAAALANFLWWAVHEGQKFAEPLSYSVLPAEFVGKVEARLRSLKSGGKVLLSAK